MALHLRRGRLSSERGADMNRTVGIVLAVLGLIGIVLAFLVFNGLGGLGAGHNKADASLALGVILLVVGMLLLVRGMVGMMRRAS
jgi:protein-S-isoprenylcysteine O-methyltransferase Ste14